MTIIVFINVFLIFISALVFLAGLQPGNPDHLVLCLGFRPMIPGIFT
jgi:hypothetical protein